MVEDVLVEVCKKGAWTVQQCRWEGLPAEARKSFVKNAPCQGQDTPAWLGTRVDFSWSSTVWSHKFIYIISKTKTIEKRHVIYSVKQ